MKKSEELLKKLYHALGVISCSAGTARVYGGEERLTYSEISFLRCVRRNSGARAGELSMYLGITNGAVAQLAKKLEGKGYLSPYRAEGNKKEIYYSLSPSGERACRGYARHFKKANTEILDYLEAMDKESAAKLGGLLDVIIASAHPDRVCGSGDGAKARCEKCRTIC